MQIDESTPPLKEPSSLFLESGQSLCSQNLREIAYAVTGLAVSALIAFVMIYSYEKYQNSPQPITSSHSVAPTKPVVVSLHHTCPSTQDIKSAIKNHVHKPRVPTSCDNEALCEKASKFCRKYIAANNPHYPAIYRLIECFWIRCDDYPMGTSVSDYFPSATRLNSLSDQTLFENCAWFKIAQAKKILSKIDATRCSRLVEEDFCSKTFSEFRNFRSFCKGNSDSVIEYG